MLKMGSGGHITNNDNDYIIDETGITIQEGEFIGNKVRWLDYGTDDEIGSVWATGSASAGTLFLRGGTNGAGRVRTDAEKTILGGLTELDYDGQIHSGTGEITLVGNQGSVIGLTTNNNPQICRITHSASESQGALLFVINRGSKTFYFKDRDNASLSGANIKTAGGTLRQILPGGMQILARDVNYWYLSQDTN